MLSVSTALVALSALGFAAAGCGDDDDNGVVVVPDATVPDATVSDTGTVDTGATQPALPTLGAQIDRMGRPAINTALNHTFDPNATTANTAKDDWNKNADVASWRTTFTAEVSRNLAVYDGLDTVCGNQVLASADAGATTNLQKYGTLGAALADDRLFLNTGGTTSDQYLAVELAATGLAPAAATDRGGRTLPMDVIDITYSALAAGVLTGVTDGVGADATKTGGTTFPYLAAPR
jgi:hypothetical protein